MCILLGVALPLVGSTAVYKRLSSSGDALAHSALAGIAIGLAAGLHPTLISIATCVVAFLIIELLRRKFQKFSEIGVAVVLSASIGIAGILSHYAKKANFDSYLFGSILLVQDYEIYLTIGIVAVILLFHFLFYRQIAACLYSEKEAKVNGIKVGWLNFAESLLLSISIAVASKVVGSLVVSSMVVLPTAIALQFKRGYFWTMIISVGVSLMAMVGGLMISYPTEWAPGATIVIVAVALLAIILLVKGLILLIRKIRAKHA
jgi:zinc transport system permease protein